VSPEEQQALDAKVIEFDRETESHPPEFSDEALADRFAEQYEDRLRFVALWSQWMFFDGERWKRDDTRLAFNLARTICREASVEYARQSNKPKPRQAEVLASAKTRAAVVVLANDDRKLAATADQWDADPDAFNTPRGAP
jgi:putative DNA primase/helicase